MHCAALSSLKYPRTSGSSCESTQYLDANGEVVFFDVLVVKGVVDFDISPRVTIVRPLLQVECVILIRLRCRASNQPVEDGRVVLNPRAGHNQTRLEITIAVGAKTNT